MSAGGTQGCGCACACGCASSASSALANRAGLPAISFRLGEHGDLLGRMLARLSSADLPALAALRTREPSDMSIALLDAWATLGDVLSFYQERIANEGYLRTATERLSVLELGRLVGYEPRPGVAASAYVAYTLNDGPEVPIPAGARVQSTPGPDELPVYFETAEELRARAEWNLLEPRRSELPVITNVDIPDTIDFAGTNNNLKPGDRLLFKFGATVKLETSVLRKIMTVTLVFKDDSKNIPEDRTTVTLVPIPTAAKNALAKLVKRAKSEPKAKLAASIATFVELARFGASRPVFETYRTEVKGQTRDEDDALNELLDAALAPAKPAAPPSPVPPVPLRDLVKQLLIAPTAQPLTAARLVRDSAEIYGARSDVGPQLLNRFFPELGDNLYRAFATPEPLQEVFVFRQTSSLFGSSAPRKGLFEAPAGDVRPLAINDADDWSPSDGGEQPNTLFLDSAVPGLLPGDLVLVESATLVAPADSKQPDGIFLGTADGVSVHPRSAYRVSGSTTEVTFAGEWWTASMGTIRDAVVSTRAEKLTLARTPITDPIGGPGTASARTIELDAVYPALSPGRWVIVSGMRQLGEGVAIPGAELVMLAAVEQAGLIPPSKVTAGTIPDPHTVLTLAGDGLAYTYARDTVSIFGNVVLATHGETRSEVLGAGDATRSLQTFALKKPPLTYVPAPTPAGVATTLVVRVNDVAWSETDTLAALSPRDRGYVVGVADDGTTSITFGTGAHGARLPTGVENVKAVYRSGIGRGGNVKAGQLNLLQTRPLGVRDVINPLPASGGADPDTRDQARRNVPLSVAALDRLVSVADYASFSRTFAGIAKATAERLVRAGRPLVHVTVSGQENAPLAPDDLLMTSLGAALAAQGDPALPIELTICPLAFVAMRAGVRIAPDHVWEVVVAAMRAALVDAFGFDRRDIGQTLFLSEMIAVMQNVDGVDYVDVDALTTVAEADVLAATSLDDILGNLANAKLPQPPLVAGSDKQGARLVYLNPTLPDLLVLQEITP